MMNLMKANSDPRKELMLSEQYFDLNNVNTDFCFCKVGGVEYNRICHKTRSTNNA